MYPIIHSTKKLDENKIDVKDAVTLESKIV